MIRLKILRRARIVWHQSFWLPSALLTVALEDSAHRAVILSYLFAAAFFNYGFTSLEIFTRFKPGLTLWDNLWPRIFLNALPFVLTGFFLARSKISARAKVFAWIFSFSIILHLASWCQAWPIALGGNPSILPVSSTANVFLISIVYSVVSPPARDLFKFTLVLATMFALPMGAVAFRAGDPTIFRLIIGDLLQAITISSAISLMIYKIRVRIVKLEASRKSTATKFLGKAVSQAIFENRSGILEEKKTRGFLVTIDIRDSTKLLNLYGERYPQFQNDYNQALDEIISKHHGYLQKTIGDCHVINFGVVENEVDLSDVEGIETEVALADERRLKQASLDTFACISEICAAVPAIGKKYFPDWTVRVGVGVDKNMVIRAVHGSNRLELDVNGVAVNCSNRLEKFSKDISSELHPDASVLVISPFASDFISDTELALYRRIALPDSRGRRIQDFPSIKWVLVREYLPAQNRQAARSAA